MGKIVELGETVDLTPTVSGTLRIWAAVVSGAIHNVKAGLQATAIEQLEAVVADLLSNATALQKEGF